MSLCAIVLNEFRSICCELFAYQPELITNQTFILVKSSGLHLSFSSFYSTLDTDTSLQHARFVANARFENECKQQVPNLPEYCNVNKYGLEVEFVIQSMLLVFSFTLNNSTQGRHNTYRILFSIIYMSI